MSSENPATLAAKTDSQIVGLAERAESLGFDSVWVGDSVLAKPRHEPLTTLAAIAGATSSVKLGTAVYLPTLRDPVNIAHLTATVDQLSGGRLLLGVGTGTAGVMGSDIQDEYEELGVSWEDRDKLLDEQLDIIRRLWVGESLEYDGEFYQYEDASIGFQPVRDPPLYIGSGVHPEKGVLKSIRERIAEYGDGWFPAMAEPDVYERTLKQIENTVEHSGRDPSHLDKLYYLDVVIADSEETALEKQREFIGEYYPGLEQSDEELRRRGVYGTPETVREQVLEYEQAGVEHLVLRFPLENQYEQVERFAEVMAE